MTVHPPSGFHQNIRGAFRPHVKMVQTRLVRKRGVIGSTFDTDVCFLWSSITSACMMASVC